MKIEEMRLEKRKVKDLKEYPGNPRKMDKATLEKLKKSIKEFGYVQPLIVNKTNECIGGNQRLRALKELGVEEVDVIVVDLPKSKEKALNLALNKIVGEFDEDLLKSFIEDIDSIDLELTGFDDDEIGFLEDAEIKIEEDAYEEEENIEVNVKRGDIYILGNHRLICGDSTCLDDVKRLMAGEKADMVFTDPPYNVSYSSRSETKNFKEIENDNLSTEEFKNFLFRIGESINYALKDDGAIYICHSDSEMNAIPFYELFTMMGWTRSASIIWVKNVVSMGWQHYRSKHEVISYGWKREKPYFIDDRGQDTVWEVDKDNVLEYMHPTQKPVELPARAIRNSSRKGEIVLDLFGGSGSTLIASEQLGRRCFMMELDEYYCQVIINRWEKYTGKKAVKVSGGT